MTLEQDLYIYKYGCVLIILCRIDIKLICSMGIIYQYYKRMVLALDLMIK